jgi:hypothetical protein
MGCRCNERKQAITRGMSAAVRGDVRQAAGAVGFVARTLTDDARSGALRTAATAQLAQLRAKLTKR